MPIITRYIGSIILYALAGCIASAQPRQSDDYVLALKDFLSADHTQYEALFSLAVQPRYLPNKLPDNFVLDVHPVFYRFRRAEDGFFLCFGGDSKALRSFETGLANGVVSNRIYWSFSNKTLTWDTAKLDGPKSDGRPWLEMAEESEHNIRTLGLQVIPGSVVWHGMDFTAEGSTKTYPLLPGDRQGKRIMTGHLVVSNDLPFAIYYESLPYRFEARFTYKDPIVKEKLGLPSEILALSIYPNDNVTTNAYELFDFQDTNFPSGSTGPIDVTNANETRLVLRRGANAVGTLTSIRGHWTYAIPPPKTGKLSTRVIILIAVVCGFVGLFIGWRRNPL